MTHKTKALGLVLMAVLAMSAVVAQAAQGQGKFTFGKVGAIVTGSQTVQHTPTTDHGTWNCTTVMFQGVAAALESSELTLAPTYAGCKIAGLNATVNMTGCDYLFTAGSTVAGDPNKITASLHLKCPAGVMTHVSVIGSQCKISFGEQKIANGIILDNSGGATSMDILATLNVTGIHYTVHNPAKCPNPSPESTGTTTTTNGTLTGQATISAEDGSGGPAVNFTVH